MASVAEEGLEELPSEIDTHALASQPLVGGLPEAVRGRTRQGRATSAQMNRAARAAADE